MSGLAINGNVVHGFAIGGSAFVAEGEASFPNLAGKKIVFPNDNIAANMHLYGINGKDDSDANLRLSKCYDQIIGNGETVRTIFGQTVYNNELYLAIAADDTSGTLGKDDQVAWSTSPTTMVPYFTFFYVKYADVKQYIK